MKLKHAAILIKDSMYCKAVLAALTVGIIPSGAYAAEPGRLVPTCGTCSNAACGYNDLIQLGKNFLTWAIYFVALASVASIAYAGWLYVSSAGDEGKIKKAHAVFGKVIWGIIITLAAFLIVKSILGWLGVDAEKWTLLN